MIDWTDTRAAVLEIGLEIADQDANVTLEYVITSYSIHYTKLYDPAKKLGELMGQINCVMFSPEDLSLIISGPQHRRKFIDIALSQVNPKYFYALQSYQKVLTQRIV